MRFAPDELLAGFPGPALIVDRRGRLQGANARATRLVDALVTLADARLSALLANAVASRRAVVEEVRLADEHGEGDTTLELSLLPLADADDFHVLVLGRDMTFERNFTSALVASRQLFRDLVNCSTHFAWETKRDGTFGFVSPRGALGYSARELNALPARSLIHPRHDEAGPLPFESPEPLDDVEVWLRRADGGAACLVTSSVPVFAESGEWLGTRGVCRDVTQARERDAALRRAHNRERLLSRIVEAIHSEILPERVLGAAAESTALAMHARHCWIFRSGNGAAFDPAAAFAGPAGASPPMAAARVAAALAARSDRRIFEEEIDGHDVLTVLSHYHGRANGAVCVSRQPGEVPWSDDERTLIDGVAAQLGIAIEQIATHERLERSSRTDDLTKLFNRRAFFDDVSRRLSHLRRTGRRAALLYLDLDNFKTINDRLGHQRGDEVLQQLGDLLVNTSRAGDICGRLGGDEFVLWLEEADERGAAAKARTLQGACAEIAAQVGTLHPRLGVSIGIALSDPSSEESVTDLVARADGAMYDAKRREEQDYALAPAAPRQGHEAPEVRRC